MQQRILVSLILLLPLLSNGQQQYFNKRYNFNKSGAENGFDIIPYDSGYIGAFTTTDDSTPGSAIKLMICFLDSAGNVIRAKVYGKAPNIPVFTGEGGCITKTYDNGYAISTSYAYTNQNYDVVLYKFNHQGDTLWTKQFGDSAFQTGWMCRETKDKGFVITGQTTTYDSLGDILLIKTDSLGNLQWQNHYGRQGYEDLATSIAVGDDGGYLMAGTTWRFAYDGTWPDFYFVKVDSLGNLQWTKQFGGPYDDGIWNVIKTNDGNFVGVGLKTFYDPYQHCCYDIAWPYAVKLDTGGNILWERTFGNTNINTTFYSVKELPDSSLIAAGEVIDPTNQHDNGLIVKFRSNGDSLWYGMYNKVGGQYSGNTLYDISHDVDNGFICTGYISPVTPDTGNEDIWVLKLDSNGCEVANCLGNVGIKESSGELGKVINIYPNPSNGLFYIQNKTSDEIEKTAVFNYIGEVIFYKTGRVEEIALSNAARGIYFYSCRTKAGKVFKGKIVKE